ncbi:MAG: GCN5-related N-acetyltransferase, partial [Clostridia bacterium]|nr:GCN5-related N-acetyltransferase [Clostridia bacterium]
QAFYKAMGCVEAKEYNDRLVAEEPFDCQLEYS